MIVNDNDDGHIHKQNESTLRFFEDFKEVQTIQLPSRITGLFGGACLGLDCNHEFFAFYDWTSGKLLRRIDVSVEV